MDSASATPALPSKSSKRRTSNALKDPAAPKRPLSSFFLYAEDERPRVLAQLGNISIGEVGKELGRRWAVLDKKSKMKYEKIHVIRKQSLGDR